ncbi:MAG: hypothetical protein COZ21_14165 [Bacteroidetes bacterium CG_4_10_14_3_um_filter_31_20]|nr:DUF2442 domain-containing protein [Bacteroidota bacterium]PIY02437.1 MAG: hypothetical protein COZ21_14165 [Bacteroidetes bacterium CG_4_10_14_3_um_filter_31_20]
MKWIVEIINKEPYKITCKWNDNHINTVDLYSFILEKSKNVDNSYSQLINKDRFLQVKCDGSTLYWENGIKYQDIDGTLKPGPLDIAPELLYEMSIK